jgi:hypothetical protein
MSVTMSWRKDRRYFDRPTLRDSWPLVLGHHMSGTDLELDSGFVNVFTKLENST